MTKTEDEEAEFDPMEHITIYQNVEDVRDRIADELSNLWYDPENPNDYPEIANDMDYFTADKLYSMPITTGSGLPKYDIILSYSRLLTVVVFRTYLCS